MAEAPTRLPVYALRQPEQSVLYRVVAEQLETLLAETRALPRFVEREFRRYLECGIPSHGFLRVRCDTCAKERLVPFSCKGRGFCPCCGGRRMAETAAHLVDRVFPRAPVRQWVATLPWGLRYRMAFDAKLTSGILQVFVRAIFSSLRRRARHRGLRGKLRCGAVTFVQRFGDALNLNVHFHTLALDGVYFDDGDKPRFLTLPPPDDEEVARVAQKIAWSVRRLMERRGLRSDGDRDDVDPLAEEEPTLARLASTSVRGRIATGKRAGQAVLRFGVAGEEDSTALSSPRCATVAGVSLHANVSVPANDRKRLERLCRYVARPPISGERLSRLDDGRLLYRLKHKWRDGTTHIVFEPQELMERLAALVPPPRSNLVRYHGVLAPAAKGRAEVVPKAAPEENPCSTHVPGTGDRKRVSSDAPRTRLRDYSWPELMQRVFAVDVLHCSACGGKMRILAAIHPRLGLPTRPPPVTPARLTSAIDDDPWPDDFA